MREPSHGETARGWRVSHPMARQREDGEGAIPRRDSERMAREPSHGEQMAREPSHGEGAIPQQERGQMAREPSDGETARRRDSEWSADSEGVL